MDFTLLLSFLAFAGLAASWIMLPTSPAVPEQQLSTAALASTSEA